MMKSLTKHLRVSTAGSLGTWTKPQQKRLSISSTTRTTNTWCTAAAAVPTVRSVKTFSASSSSLFLPAPASLLCTAISSRRTLTTRPPRPPPVQLTAAAQERLLRFQNGTALGLLLNIVPSQANPMRLVYHFSYCHADEVKTAKPAWEKVSITDDDDNDWPLYIHNHALLKVLGATIDVDPNNDALLLLDKQGNRLDPND